MKKVRRKTTGGKVKFHYRKERPQVAKCANCKKPLQGVKRLLPSGMKKLTYSERRPERPYGGYLCSSCTREVFKEKARMI